MKCLLDTCVWGGALKELATAGHDVIWSGHWEEDPGDDQILALAYAEDRVLITLDKDFGELAIVYGKPHRGIIRLVNIAARQQGLYAARIMARYAEDLKLGAIITVQPDRVRIRLS